MTSISSTGPIAFGCVGSFTMLESVYLKRAGALLQELSGRLSPQDDYECRRSFVGGARCRSTRATR